MMGFICYYGHVQNTSNLGDNIFTSNFLGALVEVGHTSNRDNMLGVFDIRCLAGVSLVSSTRLVGGGHFSFSLQSLACQASSTA